MSEGIAYEDAEDYTFGNLDGHSQPLSGEHLRWLNSASSQMADEYEEVFLRLSSTTGRVQESGMQVEAAWATFLESWLPPQYEVVKNKHIVGEIDNGEPPEETDIVVLRPSYPRSLRSKSHVLVGGVAAAFSVKSTLKSASIQQAAKSCARLQRTMVPRVGTARKELTRPIIYGLLASSHEWKQPSSHPYYNVSKQLFEADQKFAAHPIASLDLVCVPDLGTWNHITSVRPPMPISPQMLEGIPDGERQAAFDLINTAEIRSAFVLNPARREGDVLASFLTSLYSRLALQDRELKTLADSFSLMGAGSGGRDKSRIWDANEVLSAGVRETPWNHWNNFTFGAEYATTYGWHVPW